MKDNLVKIMMAEITKLMAEAVAKAIDEHPWDSRKVKVAIGGAVIDSAKRGGITEISYTGSSLRISFANGVFRYVMLSEYNGGDYVDEIGGIHGDGTGISPQGVFCGECSRKTCRGCSVAGHKKLVVRE